MFEIEYKGGNGIVITAKKSKLVIDPKLSVVGLKDLSVKNVVELATESRFTLDDPEAMLIVEGPGEYEVGDFTIRGIPAVRHIDTSGTELIATIYRVDIGELRIVILGNVEGKLNEEQLEGIGVVDVALLPVGGGGYTLDSISAARLARQIDPKIVIPVHYADTGVAYEVPQDPLELFIKEMGTPIEVTPKYKVKTAAALPEAMSVVQVTRS